MVVDHVHADLDQRLVYNQVSPCLYYLAHIFNLMTVFPLNKDKDRMTKKALTPPDHVSEGRWSYPLKSSRVIVLDMPRYIAIPVHVGSTSPLDGTWQYLPTYCTVLWLLPVSLLDVNITYFSLARWRAFVPAPTVTKGMQVTCDRFRMYPQSLGGND